MAWSGLATVLSKFGRGGDDYYDDEDEEYLDDEIVEEKPVKKAKGFGKISPFTTNKKIEEITHEREVFALQPESFENAHEITDRILEGYTVVLNTERCDEALARRIFDYACGTVYALNCSFGRISYSAQSTLAGIYIITPENTSISGAFQENFAA